MVEVDHSSLSKDVTSSGNRRLVTIMFSDISGYTSLMEQDEQIALETVKQSLKLHKKYLAKYHGRLVKELGDGFLCIFDSPSDAVSCAKELIQSSRTLPELNLHIGIHQGEVIFTDNDIYGAGVNIASRIDAESKPNEILVSEEVWENIKNKVSFTATFIGEKRLKNVDHPLKIYHIHLDHERQLSKVNLLWRGKKVLLRSIAIALGLFALILLIYFDYIPYIDDIKDKPYVAVIPFRYEGSDADMAYLGQSLAEDVIGQLFSSKELVVLSANSSFKLQGGEQSSMQIAESLKADLVLLGQYSVIDNNIRLRVELVDGKNDQIVGYSTFDSAPEDVITLAINIRDNIYESLNIDIAYEKANINKKTNLQAYRYHALGRSMMYDNRQQSKDSIITMFNLAIQNDPTYIDAYLGIVETYAFEANRGLISFPMAAQSMRPYLEEAKSLDGNSDKIKGYFGILHFLEFQFDKAEYELLEGVESHPNYDVLYHWLGSLANCKGDYKQAISFYDKAALLDPLNNFHVYMAGLMYTWMGQLQKAKDIFTNILNENPLNTQAMWLLANVHIQGNEIKEAIELLEKRELSNNPLLGYAYAKNGDVAKAEKILAFLIKKSDTRYVPPTQIAWVYSGLGDKENTLAVVEEAAQIQDGWLLTWGRSSTIFEPYRSSSRFQLAIAKMSFGQ